MGEHSVLVVSMERVRGDELVWNKVKNGFLLEYCSSIFKGLPRWATQESVLQPNAVLDRHDLEKVWNAWMSEVGVHGVHAWRGVVFNFLQDYFNEDLYGQIDELQSAQEADYDDALTDFV